MPVEVGAPKNNLSFLAKSCATVLQVGEGPSQPSPCTAC
jgi:hypothetical protein